MNQSGLASVFLFVLLSASRSLCYASQVAKHLLDGCGCIYVLPPAPPAPPHTHFREFCWNSAIAAWEPRNSSWLRAPALVCIHRLPKELLELMLRQEPGGAPRALHAGRCTTTCYDSSETQDFRLSLKRLPHRSEGELGSFACLLWLSPSKVFIHLRTIMKSMMLRQTSVRAGILHNSSPFVFGSGVIL